MRRLPEWIKREKLYLNSETIRSLKRLGVHTVCEEARCPNRTGCYLRPTATFLILGPQCTRNCGFCSVKSTKDRLPVDPDEPRKVALAAKLLGLRHVVITSVTRDDLEDGGASHFVKTMREVRKELPTATIEVLVPDFNGNMESLKQVLEAKPEVFNHNLETVRSLYKIVRPGASYERSLRILKETKRLNPYVFVKSGFMLGLGETLVEVMELLRDLREAGCDMITIGQYLRPSKKNLPVVEYIRPEVFENLEIVAKKMGFPYVASGPLVRSSMNAEFFYNKQNKKLVPT